MFLQHMVYIIADQPCSIRFIGATADIKQRLHAHRHGTVPYIADNAKLSSGDGIDGSDGTSGNTADHTDNAITAANKPAPNQRLVYRVSFDTMDQANHRAALLRKWHRLWLISLVEEHNPEWRDLAGCYGLQVLD